VAELVVYDITQPTNPVQRTIVSLPALAAEMVVSGNLLFVADTTAGLLIYNIATPSAPTLLSQITPSQAVYDVALDGNLALLAAWDKGLVIVDCSNPVNPTVTGQAALGMMDPYDTLPELQNKAATVALWNKIAFIGVDNQDTNPTFPNNGQAVIYGFDYSNPGQPRLVHLSSNSNWVNDLVFTLRTSGNRLFAAFGLSVAEFDMTEPRNAINLSFLPSSLRPPALSASSQRAKAGYRGADDLRIGPQIQVPLKHKAVAVGKSPIQSPGR
jgi:LVIVD repeat